MTAKTPESRYLVSQIAIRSRWYPEEDLTELHRALKVAKAAEHIQELVSAAPAPTPEQIERLRALLRP